MIIYGGEEMFLPYKSGGTRRRSWLRHYATSRKAASSIPDEVTKLKTKLRGLSPQANYTEWPPLVGEISANFCG
jgi:hypothetical protein